MKRWVQGPILSPDDIQNFTSELKWLSRSRDALASVDAAEDASDLMARWSECLEVEGGFYTEESPVPLIKLRDAVSEKGYSGPRHRPPARNTAPRQEITVQHEDEEDYEEDFERRQKETYDQWRYREQVAVLTHLWRIWISKAYPPPYPAPYGVNDD